MSASDCYKCLGTGLDQMNEAVCTCSHGSRYRMKNMHQTRFSADELMAAADRAAEDARKAKGFDLCAGHNCINWVSPDDGEKYCPLCKDAWWYDEKDVS